MCICQQHVSNMSACTRRFGKSPIQLALRIFLVIIVSWYFMMFHDVSCDPGVKSPLVIQWFMSWNCWVSRCFSVSMPGTLARWWMLQQKLCGSAERRHKMQNFGGPESAESADFCQAFEDAVREIDNLGEEGAKEFQKFIEILEIASNCWKMKVVFHVFSMRKWCPEWRRVFQHFFQHVAAVMSVSQESALVMQLLRDNITLWTGAVSFAVDLGGLNYLELAILQNYTKLYKTYNMPQHVTTCHNSFGNLCKTSFCQILQILDDLSGNQSTHLPSTSCRTSDPSWWLKMFHRCAEPRCSCFISQKSSEVLTMKINEGYYIILHHTTSYYIILHHTTY